MVVLIHGLPTHANPIMQYVVPRTRSDLLSLWAAPPLRLAVGQALNWVWVGGSLELLLARVPEAWRFASLDLAKLTNKHKLPRFTAQLLASGS